MRTDSIPARVSQVGCGIIGILFSSIALADDELPRLAGVVTDSQGQRIENAIVRVVGEKQTFIPPYRSRGVVESRTDAEGRFVIELKPMDMVLLANYQPKVQVIVWAPEHNVVIQRLPATRFMSDAPFDVRLPLKSECTVRLIDVDGKPIANALLSPAMLSDLDFAYGELNFLDCITNDNGLATFNGIGASNLKQVYAHGQSIGHQSLELTAGNEEAGEPLRATALRVQKMDTRLLAPEQAFAGQVEFERVIVSFISRPNDNAASYLWHEVQSDKQGNVRDVLITNSMTSIRLDLPHDFSYLAQDAEVQKDGLLQPIQLVQASIVTGRVIDSASGRGLENIYIDQYSRDWRLSFSDASGRFSYWVAPTPHDGFFAQDPLGRFVSSRAFYTRPEGLPDETGVFRVLDQKLNPMAQAIGTVVDLDGSPIAGAEVAVTYQVEKFAHSVSQFSDSKGQYRLCHVASGTNVKLSAQTNTARSPELEVLAEHEPLPALALRPLTLRTFSGQVLDQAGRPIQHAKVTFKKSVVFVEENFDGEDRLDSPLFDSSMQILTDEHGHFTSPPTGAEVNDVAFVVEARGFRKYHSPWIDLSSLDSSLTDIALPPPSGGHRLRAESARRSHDVRVVSSSGADLTELRFVSLGARAGRTQQVSATPQFSVELSNSPQILAAIADNHQPTFLFLDEIPPAITFTLEPNSSATPSAAQFEPRSNGHKVRRQLAGRLLSQLQPIEPSDTVYKRRLSFECLMFENPDKALQKVVSGEVAGFELVISPGYTPLSLEFIESLMPHLTIPQVSMAMKLQAAKLTDDPLQVQRYLDEVVEELKIMPGNEQASAASRVACALIRQSQSERAESLLRETWIKMPSLNEFVAKGVRQEKDRRYVGVARNFGPELALVNKRSSLKLIELGGSANEIPKLQSEAVVFLASQAKPGWQLVAQAFLDGKVDAGGVMSFLRKTDFKNVSEGLKLVEMVDSAAVRASLLLNMAEHGEGTNRSLRLSLLNNVLEELKQAQFKGGEPHPAELAAKASRMALEEDSGLLSDVLYFESLWLCDGSAFVTPFNTLCRVAQELAPNRPYAAKYLIEPCFDDWSWLYTVRNSSLMFESNRPLEVAALVDAEWAVRLAEGLMDNHLRGQRSRRLATVYSIINSWARDTLDMERPF
jgi:hypothetical protein